MRKSMQANMENKQCDVCGATAYSEYLVTCSRCEQACEHVYCMRRNLTYVPEVWFCEACCLQKKSTLEAENDPVKISSSLQKSVAPFPRNSHLKGVETGKVKHIPAEEATKLTSGTKRKAGIGPSDSMTSIYKRTPPLSTLSSLKCHLRKQNANPKKRALRTKPLCCNRPPNPKPSLGGKLELHKVDGKDAPAEAYEQPSACVQSLSTRNSGGAFLTNSQERKSVQEKDLAVLSPRFEDYENLPALDCTWTGSFEIVNMSSHSQFYDGFRAHPPGKVSRKAYEFSKKMPGILQFKLQNHSNVWVEVFDSYSPAESDIGLYFLPGDFERSVQMYNKLYKHMEMNDFAVRSCFKGVELLIFTSKKLPLHSRINMDFFLWGVFRRVKGNNVLHQNFADVPLPSSLLIPGQCYNNHSLDYDSKDNPEVVDTDIDMIDGKDVGRVEIVRPVLLLGGQHRLHIPQGTDVQFQLQSQPPLFTHSKNCKTMDGSCKGGDGITVGVRLSSDSVDEPPLNIIPCPRPGRPNEMDEIPQHFLEVKREPYPDVPPGFSRQIVSGTASDRLLKKQQRETYLDVPPGFSRQVISRTVSDMLLKKPQLEEPNTSGKVDVPTLQVRKEGRLGKQLVKEVGHGGSLGTPQALPQMKRGEGSLGIPQALPQLKWEDGSLGTPQALLQLNRENRKDLDAPPGFSRPVSRG
ncbi:hypothetical protein NE237_020459 [Protea cynaroides]|uniref:AIPP2-like SPOC-like domain-containing protein n=1 Tax=Protea cynaroides TaxID=273540 RepID=A0A9Q0HB84_9MAGN|nr:hypothetical protein NE237_020459 [Protea cynaroides]